MSPLARNTIRVAFVVTALSVAHDLAGIRDTDAPYAVNDEFVYRLFAASRAAMLAIAASLLAPDAEDDDRAVVPLAIGLIGLAANNNWFEYAPSDPLFWGAAALNYVGVGVAMGAFLEYVVRAAFPGVQTRPLTVGVIALAFAIAATGFALPWLTFGPQYEPTSAGRFNMLHWAMVIGSCVTFVLLCGRSLMTQRGGTHRNGFALAGFIALGVATTVHGVSRVASAGGEPWFPAAIDAVGQCVFAAALALTVFRHPRAAVARGARWLGFGTLVAAVVPLIETRVHDQFLAWHLDHIGAFGGDENGRMLLTIASGLGFARLDHTLEQWFPKASDGAPTDAPPAPAAVASASRPRTVGSSELATAVTSAIGDLERDLRARADPSSRLVLKVVRIETDVRFESTPLGTVECRYPIAGDAGDGTVIGTLTIEFGAAPSDTQKNA